MITDEAIKYLADKIVEAARIISCQNPDKDEWRNWNAYDWLSKHPLAPARFNPSRRWKKDELRESMKYLSLDDFINTESKLLAKSLGKGIGCKAIEEAKDLIKSEFNV